jgi:zinc ribbon protein
MSEVAQSTQQEFWRPPSHQLEQEALVRQSAPVMAESCPRCGTEYLLGSRFCHSCGGRRPEAVSSAAQADAAALAGLWERGMYRVHSFFAGFSWSKIKFPSWLGYLHFHEIKRRLGLSTGALISFAIGMVCVAGALLVGLESVQKFVDWQAIQLYRMEWLMGATASFVLGILLKKNPSDDRD